MNLSEHFTLDEFTFSQSAIRHGIDNSPDDNILNNLKYTASNMEKVRSILDKPIRVSSGYRSPALNKKVGGSNTSAHTLGYAIDFTVSGLTCKEVADIIQRSDIQYDQLIYEGTWVHISFDPKMRRQNLTAHFNNGKVSYTVGI